MLATWLGPVELTEFRSTLLRKAPFALPATTAGARGLLDWDVLAAVLASDPGPDTLVVARGELVPMPAPTSLRELGPYLHHGIGLCIRHAEHHHARLRDVATAFEQAFPGASAQVQLFVTPRATYGFSWHYDDEDVFIAQTIGKKDYFFRENTVAAATPARAAVFSRFAEETSPLCTARLHAGDFLYLPARWWHMAEALEDCLSISVGVTGAR